jgi:hypothetical protein
VTAHGRQLFVRRRIAAMEGGLMLSNATYNLMETASVISKGLHRYPQFNKDSHDCKACQQIWNEMKQADEKQLEKIVGHMKEHLDREQQATRAA